MKKIAILSGDGIGPEVMVQALKVLNAISQIYGTEFKFFDALIGGAAWDEYRDHFPDETRRICNEADAILFGSVGGPVGSDEEKWRNCEVNSILALRKAFNFNVNLRPVKTHEDLPCVLKDPGDVDILCVRELAGGIYFGTHEINDGVARDVMEYSSSEIESISRVAFEFAMKRAKKVTSIDKANVLACGRLWREVVTRVAKDFPDVEYEHMLVDNAAMQIMKNPSRFDTLLMPNMFGDIISDELSVLAGSLGMLPSASINTEGFGLYEPSGGSAQDIAGKDIANPIGMILSGAMMLRYSFNMDKEYEAIMKAVDSALRDGYRTADIADGKVVSTSVMGDVIAKAISNF
ncbi:MAG: 3-isopropylmalate dehydrogenase [bacterium]|nr:3-isopropylmalate dehydrogenase [bacterium]